MSDLVYGSAIFLVLIFVVLRRRHHPSIALGGTILTGFFFPTYWEIPIFGLPINVQTAAAIIGLLGYTFSGGSLRFRLTVCDLAIGTVLLAHIASDAIIHRGGILTPFFAYGEWILPYASGRYAFGRVSSLYELRYLVGLLVLWLGSLFIIDVLGGINILYTVTEMYAGWEPPLRAKRFGIVRSAGTTEHPIFFSGMLLALCPAFVISFCRARNESPRYWYFASLAIILIAAVLLSRAAVLAALLGIVVFAFSQFPRVRWFLFAGLAALTIFIGVNREQSLKWLQRTGGRTDDRQQVVTIDGEKKLTSSSLARLRLYDIYGRAAWRAGFFGYGTKAVTGFPPNLPYLPKEALATETVWTVENSYLLILLRFGWVGVAAFIMLLLSPIPMTVLQPSAELRGHLWCLACGILAVAALLFTVYSAYEIMFPLLWTLGLCSGLVDRTIGQKTMVARTAPA